MAKSIKKSVLKTPFFYPFIAAVVLAAGLFALTLIALFADQPTNTNQQVSTTKLATYDSCNALVSAFEEADDSGYYGYGGGLRLFESAQKSVAPESADSSLGLGSGASDTPEYSETNIQVEGVDEADFVKTDGNYIYMVYDNKLTIAQAYPASEAKVVSQITFDEITPQEIFIHKNTLLIFGYAYDLLDIVYSEESSKKTAEDWLPRAAYSFTTIETWNILDKENPEKIRSIEIEGDYLTSRKIGEDVYFVINTYPYDYLFEEVDDDNVVPLYRDRQKSALDKTTAFTPMARCADVSYYPEIEPTQFVTVGSISMKDHDAEITKKIIAGQGENAYASTENLYLAEEKYPTYSGWWVFGEYEDEEEKTIIHKFSLNKGKIKYQGNADVPGTILNQFSMDEYDDHFRIATTRGHVARTADQATSSNNIYIYDEDLEQTGALEDLAPGEKIYSARFMGKRGYLVTFKKVDPLFAIDLSDHTNPTVLGKLKIPGYSDYLHPYDDSHLIGVGKETEEAETGDFAWYQGVKMAIFDVTDVSKPKELHKLVIGDRGTDSYALNDHKAFLFDRNKNLLVVPILLAELTPEQKAEEYTGSSYGDYVYQGAFVYDLTLENGFQEKGRITHHDSDELFKKSGYYYYGDDYSVMRSLYIGDVLYTISGQKIKLNALADLADLASLDL